jgi:hypothetical protein
MSITYEQRLSSDPRWALKEGSRHFERNSGVYRTLERITRRLDELGIAYALAGGTSLFLHGYRRFTEDVDILVDAQGLVELQRQLTGKGFVPPFPGSKNLRDAESGVRVEFLVAGEFPATAS